MAGPQKSLPLCALERRKSFSLGYSIVRTLFSIVERLSAARRLRKMLFGTFPVALVICGGRDKQTRNPPRTE